MNMGTMQAFLLVVHVRFRSICAEAEYQASFFLFIPHEICVHVGPTDG